MSIATLSLLKAATSAAATGGSAMALSSDGVVVPNGVHVSDMSEADFTLRTNLTLKTRNPVRQADGTYSKAKRYMTIVVPDDLGEVHGIVFNLARIELEIHPKSSVAAAQNIELLAAQLCCDSDLASFRTNGSLA